MVLLGLVFQLERNPCNQSYRLDGRHIFLDLLHHSRNTTFIYKETGVVVTTILENPVHTKRGCPGNGKGGYNT